MQLSAPILLLCLAAAHTAADTFVLPTPNRAMLTPGKEAGYFTPTPGRTWMAGTFGCVRTEGQQLHEGLDIRATKRDRNGEATDPIYAAAAGRVAYINNNSGLSNYGKYLVLQHHIEGLAIFTTYAHLSDVANDLRAGTQVRQGQTIGTMGRTSNTRSGISKDRAHLHFEIGLRLNDRFTSWHKSALKGQRNDHGNFNGRNFVGLDPWQVFKQQQKLGSRFSLLEFIRDDTEMCRVILRDTNFPWLRDYTSLVRRNPLADREGVAGYEIVLNAYGVPFLLIPRARSEIGSGPVVQLKSVIDKEALAKPCKKLVSKRGNSWELTASGKQMFDLLRY